MAYRSMVKLINNENGLYEAGKVTAEEHAAWKENTMSKLDVFLTCNRITEDQYQELAGMLKQ